MTTWSTPLYTAAYDYPKRFSIPERSVMIAALPRSGSTFLCAALWRTGLVGAPMEYLNLPGRETDMIPRLSNGDVGAYWLALQRCRTSANGVFSYKAFFPQVQKISQKYVDLFAKIKNDEILYISRKDKIAQAVSYSRAYQSGVWLAGAHERNVPKYSREAVQRALEWIEINEAGWESFFKTHLCSPFRVYYEELIENPEQTVGAVVKFLRLELQQGRKVEIPPLVRQRDKLSDEWIAAFNSEIGKTRPEYKY